MHIVFLDVIAFIIRVPLRQAEIDEIEAIWILKTHNNVFKLDVIMDESQLMKLLYSFELEDEKIKISLQTVD